MLEQGEKMQYTKEELAEAKRQIDSTIHKLRQTLETLQSKDKAGKCRSQITLAQRRIKAFTLANDLIAREEERQVKESVT